MEQLNIVGKRSGDGFVAHKPMLVSALSRASADRVTLMDFKLTNSYSPTLFTSDGYQLVVMPMMTDKANEQARADRQAKAKAEQPTEPVAESQPKTTKRSRAKEPVTV